MGPVFWAPREFAEVRKKRCVKQPDPIRPQGNQRLFEHWALSRVAAWPWLTSWTSLGKEKFTEHPNLVSVCLLVRVSKCRRAPHTLGNCEARHMIGCSLSCRSAIEFCVDACGMLAMSLPNTRGSAALFWETWKSLERKPGMVCFGHSLIPF